MYKTPQLQFNAVRDFPTQPVARHMSHSLAGWMSGVTFL